MLYDTLQNLNQYTGLFPNLDRVISYIEETDLDALPLGCTEIDGPRITVTVTDTTPQASEDKPFETHTQYMDLHLDLDGEEICQVALGDLEEITSYDPETDSATYNAAASGAFVLGEDRFVVFMVEEPHKACIKAEGCDNVKKAVFKIAY